MGYYPYCRAGLKKIALAPARIKEVRGGEALIALPRDPHPENSEIASASLDKFNFVDMIKVKIMR